jgi:hypothetical protein
MRDSDDVANTGEGFSKVMSWISAKKREDLQVTGGIWG